MNLQKFVKHRLFVPFIAVFSTVLLLGLSYGPLFMNSQRAPADRVYLGGEEYPLDLTGNLALIEQGKNGHWQAFYNLTTVFPPQPYWMKFEYILIGKFANMFQLSALDALYTVRFFVSFGFLWFLYKVVTTIFFRKRDQILGFLCVLFGTSLTLPGAEGAFAQIAVFDALVFSRLTTAGVHYLAGGFATIVSLYYLASALEKVHPKPVILAFMAAFLASFLYAPSIVLAVSSLPIAACILTVRMPKKKRVSGLIHMGILIAAYSIVAAIPILYVRNVIAVDLANFSIPQTMEKLNPFRLSLVGYILGGGFTYILAWVGIKRVIRSGHIFLVLLLPWLLMHPIGEFVLSPFLELNRIRYFLTPYFVAFGLLAVYGAGSIDEFLKHIRLRVRPYMLTLALIVLIFGSSAYTYTISLSRANVCFCFDTTFDYGYPKRDLLEAINWLKVHTKESEIVLSDTYAGVLIPAFAHNLVYTSWWFRLSQVSEYWITSTYLHRFFAGEMTDIEAVQFLKEISARYIFYGPQERSHSQWNGEPVYPGLVEVFRVGTVVIYHVDTRGLP